MEKFIRQCVIIALIAFALMMLGDIPPDALPMGAWIAQLVGFKAIGVFIFWYATRINKEWRVYGHKE